MAVKMKQSLIILSLAASVLGYAPWLESRAVNHVASNINETEPANLANLFIGTTKGGHTFPGPTLPHGFVKVGMDT